MLSHKREGIFACRPGTEPAVEEPVGGKGVRPRRKQEVEEVAGQAREERHGDLQEERRREGPQEQRFGGDEDGVEQDVRCAEGEAEELRPRIRRGADGGDAQPGAGAEHDARGHDVHAEDIQEEPPGHAAGHPDVRAGGGRSEGPHSRRMRP